MSGHLANACFEEPDALIALVRVCGGAFWVTGGSTRRLELGKLLFVPNGPLRILLLDGS